MLSFIFNDTSFTDILHIICGFITEGSSYKTLIYTCKRLNKIMSNINPNADIVLCNHLLTLLTKFPNKKWSLCRLSENPNMTLNYALNMINNKLHKKQLDYYCDIDGIKRPSFDRLYLSKMIKKELTKDVHGTLKLIKHNKKLRNYSHVISHHKTVTWEIINNPEYKFLWDWDKISCNKNITMDIIKNNPDKQWNYGSKDRNNCVSSNKNLTWEFILENKDKKWNWRFVCRRANKELLWHLITENYNLDIKGLVHNGNLTEDMVDTIYDLIDSEDWYGLSYNYNISWEYIMDNIDEWWDWGVLSAREDLTFEIVEKYIDAPWDWDEININKFVTPELVEKTRSNKLLKWDDYKLTENPNWTLKLIKDKYDDLWDYETMSVNTNLTWKFIVENEDDRWDWNKISSNGFGQYVDPLNN